ncbi:MAG: hypothetical protein RBS39_04150 [Phycisphaerales bacterium]|nr:hypothetical protein [Phycisphaerales bacterium]
MIDFFRNLFDTSGFPARWHCGQWSPVDGWTLIISDVLIFFAYMAIPSGLFVYARRRSGLLFRGIVLLFVAFIFCCGLTHLMDAAIFWWPAYRVSGLLKAVTAVVSIVTAITLIQALPEAIKIPDIKRTNEALNDALARERTLAHELSQIHGELEHRTSQLAVRERRMRSAVGAAKAAALSWEVETGRVVWELGVAEAMRSAEIQWNDDLTDWEQLIGPQRVELLAASRDAYEGGRILHRRFDLRGHEGVWDIRMTATPDPVVKGQPHTITGMFGLVPATDSRQ